MKKKNTLFYILYLFLATIILLEIGLRIVSKEKTPGYELLLGKPWNYLLPLKPDLSRMNKDSEAFSSDNKYRIYSPLLGWDLGKNGQEPPLYFSDNRGLRCTEEAFKTQNFVRGDSFDILCIGNSFTEGVANKLEDCWNYKLGEISKKRVLNLGVGGYGIDQATLKYVHSPYWAPVVILGMVSGDLDRCLTTIYNFYIGGMKTKPKFIFNDTGFVLLNSPCIIGKPLAEEFKNYRKSELIQNVENFSDDVLRRDFLDFSYIYREIKSIKHHKKSKLPPVYRSDDERLSYCIKIVKYLQSVCNQRNSHLVVLLMENSNNVADRKDNPSPWALLIKKLKENNIDFLNPTDEQYQSYLKSKTNLIHPVEGVHYSPEGNRQLAEFLAKEIPKYFPPK